MTKIQYQLQEESEKNECNWVLTNLTSIDLEVVTKEKLKSKCFDKIRLSKRGIKHTIKYLRMTRFSFNRFRHSIVWMHLCQRVHQNCFGNPNPTILATAYTQNPTLQLAIPVRFTYFWCHSIEACWFGIGGWIGKLGLFSKRYFVSCWLALCHSNFVRIS